MHESFVKLFFNLSSFIKIVDDKFGSMVQLIRVMYDRENGLPMMMPMMANREHLERIEREQPKQNADLLRFRLSSSPTATVRGFFPPNQNIKAHPKSSLSLQQMRPFDSKTLFEGHRIKSIDKFDYEKIGRISEYVKENGVVTFLMEDPSRAVIFLRSLGYFKKHYTNSCLLRHNHTGNQTPVSGSVKCADDILVLSATIFDLPMAVPVFNFKKADGLAIAIKTYWPKSSNETERMWFCDELYLTVSKHPENIIYVDGAKVNTPGFVSSDIVTHMRGVLENEIKRRKNIPKLIEKAKKVEEENAKLRTKMVSKAKKAVDTGGYAYIGKDEWNNSSSTTIEYTVTTSYGAGTTS